MSWTECLQNQVPFYDPPKGRVQVFSGDFENSLDRNVVIKRITCRDEIDAQKAEEEGKFSKEDIDHPQICRCMDIRREPITPQGFFVYLIFPRMPQTLSDEIRNRNHEKRPYTEAELRAYYDQLLDLFAYLQQKSIAHRDIKPENILLDSKGLIKTCDFGFAKYINLYKPQIHSLKATLPYAAPALKTAYYREEGKTEPVEHDPFKSDVFSLGMTLLHSSLLDLSEEIRENIPLQPDIDSVIATLTSYSGNWRDLLRRLLEVDEFKRPDFLMLKAPVSGINIPTIPPTVCGDLTQNSLSLTVKNGLNYVRVSETRAEEVPCMISIKAAGSSSPRTQGVDVVCVIDKSGSMEGEVIKLVKMTLAGMVELLSPQDCLSLVCFNEVAELMCPLVNCSEEGKIRQKTPFPLWYAPI